MRAKTNTIISGGGHGDVLRHGARRHCGDYDGYHGDAQDGALHGALHGDVHGDMTIDILSCT